MLWGKLFLTPITCRFQTTFFFIWFGKGFHLSSKNVTWTLGWWISAVYTEFVLTNQTQFLLHLTSWGSWIARKNRESCRKNPVTDKITASQCHTAPHFTGCSLQQKMSWAWSRPCVCRRLRMCDWRACEARNSWSLFPTKNMWKFFDASFWKSLDEFGGP